MFMISAHKSTLDFFRKENNMPIKGSIHFEYETYEQPEEEPESHSCNSPGNYDVIAQYSNEWGVQMWTCQCIWCGTIFDKRAGQTTF